MKRVKPNLKEVQQIIDTVSSVTHVSKSEIRSRDRHLDVATARFMIYYILYHRCRLAYNRIGKILHRTHAAVMYGVAVAESWTESNRFRDKSAIDNGEMLKQILDKLDKLNDRSTK